MDGIDAVLRIDAIFVQMVEYHILRRNIHA